MGRVDAVLTRGRRRAEALMVDTGQALEFAGLGPVDENTLEQPELYNTLFTSPFKFQLRTAMASVSAEAGGREAVTFRLELHLPISQPLLAVGNLWEVTTAHSDPAEVGRRVRIVSPVYKTHATARRYEVEEVVG